MNASQVKYIATLSPTTVLCVLLFLANIELVWERNDLDDCGYAYHAYVTYNVRKVCDRTD